MSCSKQAVAFRIYSQELHFSCKIIILLRIWLDCRILVKNINFTLLCTVICMLGILMPVDLCKLDANKH